MAITQREFCTVEKDGHLTIVTINRPDVMNSTHYEADLELDQVWDEFAEDPEQWVGIITGAGDRAFSTGNDLKMHAKRGVRQIPKGGFAGLTTRFDLDKPVIAAVNGFALGGGVEISMACDIRFASEKAFFGQPEILIGLIPGWGGTQRLPRIIGMGRAKELILGGAQINAQRAYEIGLVNRVFPPDDLMPETQKFARKLAGMPGFALKMAKHSINFGYDLALDNACRIETECCAQCFSTDDQKEGMKAFLEKRKPVFTGR